MKRLFTLFFLLSFLIVCVVGCASTLETTTQPQTSSPDRISSTVSTTTNPTVTTEQTAATTTIDTVQTTAKETTVTTTVVTTEVPDTAEPSNPYRYTDFTASEKSTYLNTVGFVIPFLPNDDYFVEAYDEYGYIGVYYSALCESQSAFKSYLALYSTYTNDGTDVDDYGDVWYLYSKNDIFVDICYYESEGSYYVDVDVYYEDDGSVDIPDIDNGSTDNADLITNVGVGLPANNGNGIHKIDFTKASKVKDVADQGSYLDGCPTVGSPNVLVIPIDFSDATAQSKGYSIDTLVNAFIKNGQTDYYSVYDYFYTSSYGQLTLDITVLDTWFRPKNTSRYYAAQTIDYYGETTPIGDQMILDEALDYLDDKMDLSQFDSDKNGIIDSVILVTTLDVNEDEDFYWTFRYWNIYTDNEGYYYEYDNVCANDYLWMPYQFLYESYDDNGDATYTDTSVLNTYTLIHEFSHILGADDYYDTSYVTEPMQGLDIMDSMTGDHNAYSKFNFGWITSSRLVVTDSSVTLTLKDFTKTGDTVILANNWSDDLGAYQEYFIIVYYTNEGLNGGEYGYFDRNGILVYHVNASLYQEEYEGEIYYDVYNNNTDPSDSYGTTDNLIEYVTSDEGYFTYVVGDTLGVCYDDQGNALGYTFCVDNLTDSEATLTFTKRS